MSTFQLYKKRDFSTYINDTLQFFKKFGKNFFRNYVIINGALLLVLCAVYFVFMKENMANIYNPALANSWFMNNDNVGIFIGFMFIFLIITVVFSVLSIAFPMEYFNLIDTTENESFTPSEIFNQIKKHFGRIFIFGLISMFILMPIMMIFITLGVVLSFIIIGIPLLLLGFPTMMIWGMQSLYIYILEDAGYFEALKKGWKITFRNYWHVVGSTIIMFLIVTTLGSSISMIPSIMNMSAILSGASPESLTMTPAMLGISMLGMIVTYVFYNLLYVHQALVYYSSIESSENYQALTDIDSIGNNEE